MKFGALTSTLLSTYKIPHGFLSNHNVEYAKELNAQEPKISTVKQVHGTKLVWVQQLEKRLHEADALASKMPNTPIGVHSADCTPLLLAGLKNQKPIAILAVHAGWRGTAAKIVASSFSEFHSQVMADQYVATIGPCIQYSQFEVGEEVVREFPGAEENGLARFLRMEGEKKKFQFDLPGENARQLLEAAAAKGVKVELDILPFCTLLEKDDLPSFRRDREKAGRILSWITFPS